MREYETVRIYGKTLETWYAEDDKGRKLLRQIEIEYKEYEINTGRLVAVGSEDFSRERYHSLITKMVWTWDGEKRNAGGHRWFNYQGAVHYIKGKGKEVKTYLKNKYNTSSELELR